MPRWGSTNVPSRRKNLCTACWPLTTPCSWFFLFLANSLNVTFALTGSVRWLRSLGQDDGKGALLEKHFEMKNLGDSPIDSADIFDRVLSQKLKPDSIAVKSNTNNNSCWLGEVSEIISRVKEIRNFCEGFLESYSKRIANISVNFWKIFKRFWILYFEKLPNFICNQTFFLWIKILKISQKSTYFWIAGGGAISSQLSKPQYVDIRRDSDKI